MSRLSPIEGLLVLGILVCAGAHFVLGAGDASKRNLVFAPNMYENPGYESQDPNPNFADGKTLQRPVAGTIARGSLPLHQGELTLDITTVLWREMSPEQQEAWDAYGPPWDEGRLDDATKAAYDARGRFVYETFCLVCHGAGGKGDGTVTQRGVPPPKSFQDPDIVKLTDGRMFRSVTLGKANMPAYASQVEREDRWKAIRYIRSLQQAP
jgi:mono/diheme cytochrome c family protein